MCVPYLQVHLFGSWANGLSITSNNDIDVCLEIDDLPDEQACPLPLLGVCFVHCLDFSAPMCVSSRCMQKG
jgi:hypothetical protein